jgi:hypothetical protein
MFDKMIFHSGHHNNTYLVTTLEVGVNMAFLSSSYSRALPPPLSTSNLPRMCLKISHSGHHADRS